MAKLPFAQTLGNLETLRSLLLPSSWTDVVFVAIDFERPQYIINGFKRGYQDTQIGLAILDTRCLTSRSRFETFNFFTGEDVYFEEKAPMYRFGTAEKVSFKNMLSKINDCLRVYQNQSIVLVGHGFSSDLGALNALGFNFQQNWVIAKLDTYLLARDLQMRDFSLKNLVMELDCPCNLKFHNAGNDSNFTLRALLLLGIKAIGAAESKEMPERVNILWRVALKGVISERQRQYMRRKAKIRTPEEQEEIRAIRRQRRDIVEMNVLECFRV